MATPVPTRVCEHCEGKGSVEINELQRRIVAALRREGGELTASELARFTGAKHTTVINNLHELERAGHVKSRVEGKARYKWTTP